MQIQVNIPFEQLLQLVKALPKSQLKLLKNELSNEVVSGNSNSDLELLLLNGPVATKRQLEAIEQNRKAINEWKTK